ncbi:MAG: alcohol acetyltransferase [Lachnospiraceae bacterium]|nr:alcohol acetyltransferase [Lachnospiraceae bacterium]
MSEKKRDVRKNWYPLDLSGTVYPTLQRKDYSAVFRLSMTLDQKIDPVLLQQAVDQAMPRFPTFKVAMRKGLFWRYLEPNHRPGPFVQEDIANPCMPMSFKGRSRYLVRFYYYENEISLEMFHSLSDGNGGMCLLKTVAAQYLRLQGSSVSCGEGVMDLNEEPDPEELEDAYARYARSRSRSALRQKKAYRVRGTREPFYTLNVIRGVIPVGQALKVAKSYGVSLTEYLNGALIYALMRKQKSQNPAHQKPIKLAMPVNLRNLFPSRTMRNFIVLAYPSIDPMLGDYTFEEIVKEVHNYMRYYINPKFLGADITTDYAVRANPLIRIVPLFIKDFVVRSFYIRVQDKQSSAGLTNMGIIRLPDGLKEHTERIDILMGQPFSARTNCAVVTYQDQLSISFASCIRETDVERLFFTRLVQDHIPVKIETNRSQ